MTFDASMFANFVAVSSPVHERVSPSYTGIHALFDIIVVGSGIGGGVLADDLADRAGDKKRILVLEAGSYLYPTHVYNCSRMPNSTVAQRFGTSSFWQSGAEGTQYYIHERPQMNLGGRSIFWSGLIPTIQDWELEFFPARVRHDLKSGMLEQAGAALNQSITLGETAQKIVGKLRASALAEHFDIAETPRALHQPYLRPNGTPAAELAAQSTGVFNTAELLINQIGLSSNENPGGDGSGLRLLLNHYVEDIKRLDENRLEVLARNTLTGAPSYFQAATVVLACGAIESPKLLARSTIGRELPAEVRSLVGLGLTDHPTTNEILTTATDIGDVAIPKDTTAKIILYSRGKRDAGGQILYPFNVEMNVNHEYWHLRENDPASPAVPITTTGASIIDIKFSFGNCIDPMNEIRECPPFGYVPEIVFRNQSWTDYLVASRLPALAGWHKSDKEVFAVLNEVTHKIFNQFQRNGVACEPVENRWYGEGGKGFGYGTVHHAIGTLRMPYKQWFGGPVLTESVVDEDLRVRTVDNLFVCDMSVMPFASAANPVRTLAALALRLSNRLG
ncbi:GMC oxidoreductase [Ensifer aridi]|uniref:GMC oxidoreductase n=1 Tax=Ensifer aridi TaxID=1708715 RepID=UPI000A1087C2|nr:GMC oxidoreductase [Ensifer aridi]